MIHRARHSFIKGKNACVFNFFRQLKSEFDRHDPDIVYLVSEGRPHHRHKILDTYKANRPKEVDEDFREQMSRIYSLVKFLPVNLAVHKDFEGDDVIAHLASNVYCDDQVVILSSDTDFIQLLTNENICLWNPIKKQFIDPWPVDYLTFKSLKGDPADNIKGVPGVGEKTAMRLTASPEALSEFFNIKPLAELEYTRARNLIKFADVTDGENQVLIDEFNMDMKTLLEEFRSMNFKSIIGKSWPKWIDTMERINESRQERNNAGTAS